MASRKEYEMLINLVAKYNGNSAMSKAQKDLASVSKGISEIYKTQNQLKSFSKLQADLKAMAEAGQTSGKEFAALTKKAEALEVALKAADVDTKDLSAAEADLATRLTTLKKKEGEIVDAFQDYQNAAEDDANSTKNLGNNLDYLVASQAFQQIYDGVKKVISAFKECVSTQIEFEASISNVQALSGATGNELTALEEKAKELGSTTKFTASEAADAFGYMSLAGWSTQQSLSGIDGVLQLAAASGMDLASASDMITDYLSAFNMEASDAVKVADMLAYAQAHSNTSATQLGEAYGQSAANLNAAGQSIETVTALLEAMANQGTKGSTAGTYLSAIMAQITQKMEDGAITIGKTSIAVQDAEGNYRDLIDILGDVQTATDGMGTAEKNAAVSAVFNRTSLSGLNLILGEGVDKVRSYKDALGESTGAAQQMASTMLDNTQGSITKFESALDGLKLSIGEALAPEIRKAIDAGTEALGLLTQWTNENPRAVKGIAIMVTALGGLAAALTAVAAAKKMLNGINGILGSIGTSGVGVAGAVLGIGTAVAAVGVAIYEMYDAWRAEVPSVRELTEEVRNYKKAVDDANTSKSESLASAEATSQITDRYITKLEELEAAGLSVGNNAEEYHNTLALLNAAVPELSQYIDLQTDSIIGGTAALREHAEAIVADAKAQAYYKYLEDVMQGYNDVVAEVAKNQTAMLVAQEENNQLTERNAEIQGLLKDATGMSADEYNALTAELESNNEQMQLNDQEMANLKKAVNEGQGAIEDANKEVEAATKVVNEYEEAQNAAASATEDAADATEDAADAAKQWTEAEAEIANEKFNQAVETKVQAIQDLCQAYDDAYKAAADSVSGQYSIWDEAKEVIPTSIDTMMQRIQEQTTYWENYNANLDYLKQWEDKIPGLTTVINSFADGSEESVNAVAGLAAQAQEYGDQAPEVLQGFVDAWQGLQEEQAEVATNIAETTGITEQDMANMVEELASTVRNMDYSYEASAAAAATFDSYNKTASSWLTTIANNIATRIATIRSMISEAGTITVTPTTTTDDTVGGHATGTLSAEAGYSMVGENGPELMYLSGGQKIITAAQTRALVQHAYDPNIMAQDGASSGYNISVAPVYNITGSNADSVRNVLEENNNSLKSFIVQTIREAQTDTRRRAYA